MHLLETIVTDAAVRMRYADNPDPNNANEWIDFQIPLIKLADPHAESLPLGDPEIRFVAEIRLAALRHVRDLIGDETRLLSDLVGRIRP